MGIRFTCPNGHKLNVKEYLAGKRAVCPHCGAKFTIPSAEPGAAAAVEGTPAEMPAGDFGSASMIIPTVEAPRSSPIPASDLPPAIVPGMVPPEIASATGSLLAGSVVKRRPNHSRTQLLIAVVLLMIAIALVIVLVLVLSRGPNSGASESPPAALFAPAPAGCYAAVVNHSLPTG
jgi:hypothetical protein